MAGWGGGQVPQVAPYGVVFEGETKEAAQNVALARWDVC